MTNPLVLLGLLPDEREIRKRIKLKPLSKNKFKDSLHYYGLMDGGLYKENKDAKVLILYYEDNFNKNHFITKK